jgi:hypothetical protein
MLNHFHISAPYPLLQFDFGRRSTRASLVIPKRAEGAREPAPSETEGNLLFASSRPFRDRETTGKGTSSPVPSVCQQCIRASAPAVIFFALDVFSPTCPTAAQNK